MWTVDELVASMPRPLPLQAGWKATASHNAARASGAFNFAAWTTGAPQQPGMWFQIELPEATAITEIQFNSAGGGFGGRGRGRRGAAPPARAAAPAAGGAAATATAQAPAPPAAPPVVPTGTYPRAYTVEVSMDGSTWTSVAEGAGKGSQTSIAFAPVRARFIRLTQTAAVENAPAWSMQRLMLYGPGQAGGR
jgi:hypothetical protein